MGRNKISPMLIQYFMRQEGYGKSMALFTFHILELLGTMQGIYDKEYGIIFLKLGEQIGNTIRNIIMNFGNM
jgi:hypothetical protein